MTNKERKFLYGAVVVLLWMVSSCSYVSVLYLKCCDHWEGPLCDIPLCDGYANPNACSYSPGITVTTRNSGSFTTTGGTCADANVCADCNPGAYPNGPYCSACTSIDHCLHPDCTNSYNSVCKYCEGEVLEQYGWYAYTRFYPGDNHQQCRQACSWRPGSRCYPGTCDDTTTDSCRCIEGFTGPDCNTITEEPVILQNFLRLTEVTETSVNHVEAPIDSTSGSPQPVVWTNNVKLEKFSAYVDGYFKVDLPVPPDDFYVHLDGTRIGIIHGEIKLEWKRGNNFVESALDKNCKTEPPTASHRCEFEAVFKDWYWNGIFEHGDNLVFTVSVTNGGYVAVYNREASSYVEYYSMSEVTKTNVFEVWFDSISPSHCAMGVSDCTSDPLIMLDATTNDTVVVEWSGWYDDLSGLEAYRFEVFHLQSTGGELVHGDLVPDAAPAQVPLDTTEATITFPVAGPYAVTMAVYDKAGNHRTTRRIIVFDDDPKVSLQGQRSYNADMNGACTWESTPSPLLVTDASPNASCNWITSEVSVVNVVWRHRFINTKHHAGHWLDYVKSLEHIDIKLDDHIGLRRTKKVINVLGITRFQYAYNITSVVDNIQYPLKELKEIEKESLDIGVNFYDGMKLDIQVRAIDITGGYADDFLTVKMDSSPPIIEDLWLTRGKRVNISVHYIEDLTKLQIEWEAWDLDSGIDELYWRIFDNFTGQDIDHGMSHLSPQGNSQDDETCNTLYESYPGGPMCYCTHDDGCFHHHFYVQPEISIGEQNGLHESKHQAVHDSDYFIEVTATNKARLKTTRIIKITIDVSPPLGGVVQEGVKGEPELDFQQDLNVNVHWSDFFDKESGIMFYRYGYGSECLTSEDFDIHNGKELFETTMTETSFQVEQEGKYYVTVAAYNHALDHSSPVCSDGVTIDTSLPVVTDFKVDGAMVDPRLLIDTNRSFWFLHDDRTKQRVNTSSDHCRLIAKEISDEQLQEIPFSWNNKGGHQKLKMTGDQCRKSITNQTEIISTIHIAKHISLSWNVTGNTISVYNFEIGLSSTQSANPDLLKFISSEHHQHLRISHPNLNEGVHFFFVIKSISRAGVENIQAIGPFVLVTTPPTFDGVIFVEYYPGKNYLLAYWTVSAFQDIIDVVHLDYQFAVAPIDSTSGSPQPVVWTNNVRVEKFYAYVDGYFKVDLPVPPDEFYVSLDQTRIGIIRGEIKLEWKRGNNFVESALNKNCKTEPPTASHHCEFETVFKDWSWNGIFEHGDNLVFTVSVTNGGYVAVYNREASSYVEYYSMSEVTKTNVFEVWFDSISPSHCAMGVSDCTSDPLIMLDATTNHTVVVEWSGWYDDLSGLKAYHFEVFHLQPAGEELVQGDLVPDAAPAQVPFDTTEATITFPVAGPYAVTMAVYDKAGNHRTTRRIIVFDDDPKVSLQGQRSYNADMNGACTWESTPSPLLVTDASPNASCNWITSEVSVVNVVWRHRFINTKHHAGHWLDYVKSLEHIDIKLDDHIGLRRTKKVINVLGITRFQYAYNITSVVDNIQYPLKELKEIEKESLDIGVNFYDGMKLDIQVRAIDITGGYADDFLTVKMDSSPPIIEDLWLTRGKRVNISVHYIEDLTKLQIEWEAWDLDSGIDELYWRIFDNFTGQDIDHGMSHLSPQGNSQDDETCNTLYESYPGGPMCYCTHDDGCFHHHFYVQPEISIGEQNGLHESKHQAVHDSDYFIEVTATNKARLKTTRIIKITIDVSPPLGGVVQEGVKGEPELDFQQDLNVNVHWSDFFDKESGIMFYRYGYGSECLTSEDFDIHNGKELFETTMTETSFQVEQEGKYYVTVAAYNHALDHSSPVCSDGVTIDTSLPVVTDFKVDGAMVDPRLLIDTNRSFWFLHDDRTKQRVNTSSDHCRLIAKEISDEQLQEIPFSWNNKGGHQKLKMTGDQCRKSITNQTEIISTIHIAKHISLSWNVTGNTISVYNFEIGLSSTQSANPDLLKFISSEHHQHLRISHPNLNEGVHFFFVIKSISRAGVENIQAIGPFVLVTTPPTFDGVIFVEYYPGKNYLLAYWTVSAFQDIIDVVHLDYQFAVGTSRYGIDIYPFTDLKHFGVCEHTIPPTCTAIPLNDLEWDMHHSKEYFITIQVNNTAGLATRVTSKPYQHDVLPPSAGVVIDVDVSKSDMVQDIDDIDYQKNTTELSARWYGFEHCYSAVKYTACVIDENDAILNGTCIYLGIERATTFLRLQLDAFKTYKILVTAETDFNQINATSDGVTIIDNNVNIDKSVNVFDGIPCQDDKVILDKDMTHQEQNIHIACVDDITHQLSVRKLAAYWHIPDDWKQFMPDVYWHIEERAPVVEFWTALTDKVHVSSSSQQVSTNYPLNPGRSYRFGLQFCAADLCYKTLFTSGVTIIPNPPKAGPIMVSYLEDGPRLEVIFKKFYSDEVEDLEEAQQSMSYYEWNIADNDISGRVLYKWAPVDTMDALNQTHAVSLVTLKQTIQFSKCLNFLLRGFTKAGSFTVATKNIKPCDDRKYVKPRLVVDCVGESVQRDDAGLKGLPIWLGINERWLDDDKDYTPHTNILSAVWPELRYELYDLAVIELDSTDLVPYYRDNLDLRQPCDYPTSILCDQTGYNFVNVEFEPGDLIHGRRYIICIHANAMVLHHEFWDEELPDISTCSDGVTVDIYPPIPAAVWLYEKSASYQASDSETTVYWGKFTDIEEHNGHVHESGISSYKIALGTSHGGVDVVPFTDVGITNHITFHNLRLQNGHSYFATVIGYDFTGQSSSSTSGAIVVDTTPPIKSNKEITIGARYITTISSIEACWTDVFSDPESGMAYYKWGVGSRPLYDDKYGLTITSSECSQTTEESPLDLVEGHSYFITVLGFNNVGLFTVAASWAFTMDLTSPNKGYVNDGEQKVEDTAFDIDYQTERSMITAHWGGFSDPHTHIKEYKVSVGTWKEGQDVVAKQAIGLRKHITIDHLQLHEGITYYVSITACNYADLCATATSDGVLVDTSPPVPGKVIDGVGNTDIRYQASRHFIGSKWFGFTDPQSGLSHFTWRVGTAPTGDDIVRTREVHLNEIAVIPDILNSLGISLPLNKMIYSTVRAYNKGGLQSESSSNGFLVDDTPPIFKLPITHVRLGSVFPFTSVLRSSLKVKWDVEDKESYISRQHLSIAAHREDDFNISIEVGGLVRDYTFTRLQLHDGSIYTVKIISCNGARLCAISILQNLLIDSTPPVSGTFAINTDHAVSQLLNRQPDSWMVWNASSINLAWLGFSDIHSGILEYHINIGSSYMAMDLNMDTNQTYVIKQPATWIEDGSIQTQIVNTSSLKDKYFVFVSMWAVNRVGLISTPIHSQFYLVPGGVMQLIRRCDSHSCQGHCVCAAQDFKCKMDTDMTCYDKSGDILYANILVEDVIILTADNEDSTQITHTPTEMMLSAKWSVISGVTPLWYEWSVGRRDAEKPTGVYGTDERIWHDACTLHSWTFTLPKGSFLHDGEAYSFFIRAWFDEKTFSVFKSHGVVIQTLPPETSNIFGKMVKEIHNVGLNDVDFIAPGETLLADWEGKFKSPEAVAWYRLYISSEPIGHDIHFVYEDLLPTVTMYNLTGIYQDIDTRFYTNIIAYNHAGLHTIASSDGCQIDKDNPIAGVVYDGSGFRDIHYQNTSNHVSASWQGFIDLGSSLQTYHWCVSTADTIGSCSVLPVEDIGLATSIEKLPVNSPQNGEELVSEVWATDQVSHSSNTVLSDGVIVDSSPPVRLHHLQYEKNLIQNPSFEDSDSPVAIDGLTLTHSCHNNSHKRWYVNDDSCGVIAIANADIVQDGTKFLTIKGSIFQAVSQLNIGSLYKLTFYSSHLPLINAFKSNTEGFVDFDGDTRPFMLYARPNRSDHTFVTLSWHLHTIVFKPLHARANISIGSYENLVGIAIDNIQLQEIISSDKDSDRAEGHVVAHTVFIHSWSSIHASWNFYDAESGIKEYLWAIGTVQGGTQLQEFKSVGVQTFDTNSKIYLSHNTTVYTTVVAVNGAGLRTVSYSYPLLVDLTPPLFEYVNDGFIEGSDVDFQSSWSIGVNFKVIDLESPITACGWGVGIQTGDISLQKFVDLPNGNYSAQIELPERTYSMKIYVTVRCKNKAGLQTTMSSDGITIKQDKPTSDNFVVEILGHSPSHYPVHANFHGTKDQFRFRWTGFAEEQWIQKYKVNVRGPSQDITSYVEKYNPGYTFATFNGMVFEDGIYEITVTAVDWFNIESDPVSTSVTVLTALPSIVDDMTIMWNNSNEKATVSWDGVFNSDTSLYYEVSVGNVKGSGDIIQWQETKSKRLVFNLPKEDLGTYGKNVYAAVTAITPAGTFKTTLKEVLLTPPSD